MADNEKIYELRELTADDVFPMFRIISKIGIKEFKDCFGSESVRNAIATMAAGKESADLTGVGVAVAVDIAGVLCSNLPNCREEIYQFLAQISGMKKDDVAKLPMVTFFEMVIDVIKKPEFKDFFTVVSRLFK